MVRFYSLSISGNHSIITMTKYKACSMVDVAE